MTFTITLQWWVVLPLLLTMLLLAGGLWLDGGHLAVFELEGTVLAVVLALIGWAAIFYGRYEHWLVLPTFATASMLWQGWREKSDRDAWKSLATIFGTGWVLVLYGRLTA